MDFPPDALFWFFMMFIGLLLVAFSLMAIILSYVWKAPQIEEEEEIIDNYKYE